MKSSNEPWPRIGPSCTAICHRLLGSLCYQHTPAGKSEPFLHLYLCRTCGVRAFTTGGFWAALDGELYAVNLGCLDDASDEELARAEVSYLDGRHDDWSRSVDATRYL